MSELFNWGNLPPQAPELIGGIGQFGATKALVERFGTKWRKTPSKSVWCLESPGLQFTIMALSNGLWDIAAYEYETIAEFRAAYVNGHHGGNAVYFQTQSGDKYTGVAVIRWMQQRGYMAS